MLLLDAIKVLTVAITVFVVAFSATPFVLTVLRRIKAGKQIRADGSTPVFSALHKAKEGTPTMGGIVIWGSVLGVAFMIWFLHFLDAGFFTFLNFIDRAQTYLPLAAMIIAAGLGLMDDILGVLRIGPFGGGMKIKHKLVVYTLISLLGAWWFYSVLGFTEIHVPFFPNPETASGNWDIGFWYVPIFMFILIASAFAANETDGLDGLFGGVSLFSFGALTVIAFAIGKTDLATLGAAIIGGILAFLWFNIHPAKFFMGDTGSMALGITMGVMAMLTNTVLLLPFFAIIPVIESLSVIFQKISKKLFKRKIFLSTPIHHHFEAIGWPESQVTMRFWIISVIGTAIGLVIFFVDRFNL